MRGSAVSHSCTASRRVRYSFSMAVTGACEPVSAATAAFCVMEVTFDVEWLCSALEAAMTAAGPICQPHRQPVMAYAFDDDPHKTVRSRQVPARMPGRLCGTGS